MRTNKRKKWMSVCALLIASSLLFSACGPTPEPQVVEKVVEKEVTKVVEKVVEKEVTVAPVIAGGQAPSLKAKVETGELPDVDERVPADPWVLDVFDEI